MIVGKPGNERPVAPGPPANRRHRWRPPPAREPTTGRPSPESGRECAARWPPPLRGSSFLRRWGRRRAGGRGGSFPRAARPRGAAGSAHRCDRPARVRHRCGRRGRWVHRIPITGRSPTAPMMASASRAAWMTSTSRSLPSNQTMLSTSQVPPSRLNLPDVPSLSMRTVTRRPPDRCTADAVWPGRSPGTAAIPPVREPADRPARPGRLR